MLRQRLITICQDYHEYVHLAFSLLALALGTFVFSLEISWTLLLVAIIAGYLPDVDHLLFMFFYGRHTRYAQNVLAFVKKGNLGQALEYCRVNHKSNNFIISHNLLTPTLTIVLSIVAANPYLKIFFLSFSFHFIFDILEDFLALGRLNPNWYFKFKSN